MSDPRQPDFQTFVDVARLLNSSLDLDVVLRELLAGLDRLLMPTDWSLLLEEESSGELVFTLTRGSAGRELFGRRLTAGEGVAGWVAAHGEPLLIPDVRTDPRFSPRMDEVSGFATRSIVAVPLRAGHRTVGVLEIINATCERAFTQRDLDVLAAYADFAAIAISNARAHAATVHASRTDALTGLHTSAWFLTLLEQAIAAGEPLTVVFFDMDRFKTLVDAHGHLAGSAALTEVGTLVREALREGEFGCRFGGDEFALVLRTAELVDDELRCRELAAVVEAHTFLVDRGVDARLSASFGAATFPDEGGSAPDLLSLADARMYASKRARNVARDG